MQEVAIAGGRRTRTGGKSKAFVQASGKTFQTRRDAFRFYREDAAVAVAEEREEGSRTLQDHGDLLRSGP